MEKNLVLTTKGVLKKRKLMTGWWGEEPRLQRSLPKSHIAVEISFLPASCYLQLSPGLMITFEPATWSPREIQTL